MPDTVQERTYCDSCSKRAIADGLNPFTMSQMPRTNNSQRNSGMVAMSCHAPPCLDDPEQHADPRSDDQGTADEPQHGHGPWHESGGVHQVAQQQPLPHADKEAGSEPEGPIMERHKRLADRDERGGIRARSLLLAHRTPLPPPNLPVRRPITLRAGSPERRASTTGRSATRSC